MHPTNVGANFGTWLNKVVLANSPTALVEELDRLKQLA